MKKLFLFLMAMICCQFSFGQEISFDDLKDIVGDTQWWSKTQDAAYEAPNSALVKKWYVPANHGHISNEEVYIQFMANGTFNLHATDRDWYILYTHEYILPGRWKRVHDKLTLTYNFNKIRFLDKYDGLSMREKNNAIKSQAKYKGKKPFTWTCQILKMDDCLILSEFYYFFEQFTKYNQFVKDANKLSFVSKEYIINQKKKQEEAKKAEE